jgi:hypothetical protein
MANKIILKRSSVSGKAPTTSDLDYGELSINYADGTLYYKNSSNSIGTIGSNIANLNVTANTISTSTTTGALTVAGGVGISGNITASGNIYAVGTNSRHGYTWANSVSSAYTVFNSSTNSIDTVFG